MESRMQKLMLWLRACAAGPHAEAEDEDGVQHDVEHTAGDEADHGEAGLALVAEDVVHHEARHHERGRDEDGPRVGAGVGQDGVGAAQQHHEVGQGSETENGQHCAEGQRREEAGGGELCGRMGVLTAEAAADDAARAVAQHEAEGLNDGHQARHDAHRARRAGGQLAHKEGVGQIVDAGDEHTQDGGGREAENELRHGGQGHFLELEPAALQLGGVGCGAGGRRHEEIPHFRKSKKIPLFAQRTGKMQIYNKYSADRGKCRDSSAGRRGGSFLLRYGDRVAAPSVCRAVACILLAAAPTAPPCFRRWRRSSPLPQKVRVLSAKAGENGMPFGKFAKERSNCL
jgi:hypothetical protein